jgi:phosphotransferase system HPr (HPr) family protein
VAPYTEEERNSVWIEGTATVTSPEGLHARPARDLWDLARRFTSEVHIVKEGPRRVDADAKSIFDIMTLDAAPGVVLLIRAKGPDAQAAVDALVRMVENGFKV